LRNFIFENIQAEKLNGFIILEVWKLKVYWVHSCNDKKYVFDVSTYQGIILTLFNYIDKKSFLTLGEIVKQMNNNNSI